MTEIRGAIELPAVRENIELHTADGLTLVGELALPVSGNPVATLVTLHPLPTAGGFMDSHIIRKSAARLPALANIAVIRFNLRGTTSPRGTSEGTFGDGVDEKHDVAAVMQFVADRRLPNPWLLGWSFGTELTLKYGLDYPISGAILLSTPLRRTTADELKKWAGVDIPLVAIIPEHDDYLQPDAAREKFAIVPEAIQIDVPEGKHLWVGEKQTYTVLTHIVSFLNPAALPLPTEYEV